MPLQELLPQINYANTKQLQKPIDWKVMTNKDADYIRHPKGLVDPGDYVKIFTQVQHVFAVAPHAQYDNMDVIRFLKRWEKQAKKPRAVSIIKPPSIYGGLEKFDAEEFSSYSSALADLLGFRAKYLKGTDK